MFKLNEGSDPERVCDLCMNTKREEAKKLNDEYTQSNFPYVYCEHTDTKEPVFYQGRLKTFCMDCHKKCGKNCVQNCENVLTIYEENSTYVHCNTCNTKSTAGTYYLCDGSKKDLCKHSNHNRQHDRKIFVKEIVDNVKKEKQCLCCLESNMDVMFLFPCGCVICSIDCWKEVMVDAFEDRQSKFKFTENNYGSLWCIYHNTQYTNTPEMFKLLGTHLYNKYKKYCNKEGIINDGGKICPYAGCNKPFIPMSKGKIECLHCKRWFCERCNDTANECDCEINFQILKVDEKRKNNNNNNNNNNDNDQIVISIPLSLRIRIIGKKYIIVDISSDASVFELKQEISKMESMDPKSFTLYLNGKKLSDKENLKEFRSFTLLQLALYQNEITSLPPNKNKSVDGVLKIKKCPSCLAPSVKPKHPCARCHHIVCPCGSGYCYICLKEWPPKGAKPCDCNAACSEFCQVCEPCENFPNCSCKKNYLPQIGAFINNFL